MAGGQYKAEGVVLRRRHLGEADDVVTFLGPGRGRFEAVARGIRKSKRASSGRLEPFNQVHMLLAPGRSLDVVGQVQVVRGRPSLVVDLDRLARGLYVLELYDRIGEADNVGDRLFRTLVRALDELEGGDADLACRRAELRLLTILGFAPQIEVCVHCGAGGGLVGFSLDSGGLVCETCRGRERYLRRVSAACRALLLSLRAPQLDEAARWWGEFDDVVRAEVEGVLTAHLDWHWPARVRSRRFLDDLKGVRAG